MSERSMKCRACGKTMYMARNPETGKWIPLHRVSTVYVIGENVDGEPEARKIETHAIGPERDLVVLPGTQIYVSHFATCTDPGRFSGRGKR